MRRLAWHIEAHAKVAQRKGYNPQTCPVRSALRRHIAGASEDDIDDMILRRFHEFGGRSQEDLDATGTYIRQVVANCKAELAAGS